MVEDHQATFDDAGVTLEGPNHGRECHVQGDETRLRQCLGNLLANAVKFTPQGGRVRVEVEPLEESVVLRVVDDGDGLEAEQMNNLFDPFEQRGSHVSYGQAGLGLGLAVVHGIVGLHDGTVGVRSDGPGRGTTFEIRLPSFVSS